MIEGTTRQSYLPPIREITRSISKSNFEDKKRQKSRMRLRTEQAKNEKQLLYEIRNLDALLNKKMKFINGFLFSTQITHKLVQSISEQLSRSISRLGYECFNKILQEEKMSQEPQSASIYKRIRNLGKNNQISYYRRRVPSLDEFDGYKVRLQTPRKLTGHIFNSNDLQRFLKKQENGVSIWVPPTSYPQFFAYAVYGKPKKRQNGDVVLRIQRFYVPNHQLNVSHMFQSLVIYLNSALDTKIRYLQYLTSKESYNQKFKKWGWMLKSITQSQYKLLFVPVNSDIQY